MENTFQEKNEELANFWKTHIDQWAKTSLSQIEYCRQQDLIPHRFTYWKRKFSRQNLPVKFVQIPGAIPDFTPGLKLNIGAGLQIEIQNDFSCDTLHKVLTVLKVIQ